MIDWFEVWFCDLVTPRDGESVAEHTARIKDALTSTLDDDVEQGIIHG